MVEFEPRFSTFGTAPESPPDPRDFKARAYLGRARLNLSDLPDEVGVVNADLHRRWLPISDQGYEGSCTGHAMRNVKGVNERRLRTTSSRGRVPDFGPRGIYTLAKQVGGYPDEEGAYMRDVTKAVHQFGVPREKDWPYVPVFTPDGAEQDIGTPTPRWLQWARPWAIGVYARAMTLEEMLFSLHQVGPLFSAMNLTETFMDPAADGTVSAPAGQELGGHAMAFLSAKQSTRKFLVANSWGTGWGLGGYCWIPFDHFLGVPHEAWTVPDSVA